MNQQVPFDKAMIARTAILLLAWINQFLLLRGDSPLPFTNEETEFLVSSLITFVASMWTWWKNNDVRYKARRNTKFLEQKGLK